MAKKYGQPYERKYLLKRGDLVEIEKLTPYTYSSVVAMLDGTRNMQPEVLAVAERLADEREQTILELSK